MNNSSFYPNMNNASYVYNNDERLVGGFAFPFLLGGVTGAAIAPAFWNNGYQRPPYGQPFGPYYGPYYRPGFGPYYRQ